MLHLMLSRSTGGEVSSADYKRIRSQLIDNESIAALVPRFVRTCHDPDAFWSFIKAKFS
jgi:hypothetical protein